MNKKNLGNIMSYPHILNEKQDFKMKISRDEELILVNAIQNNRTMIFPLPKDIQEKELLKQINLSQTLRQLYKKGLIEMMGSHCFFRATSNTELLKAVFAEE